MLNLVYIPQLLLTICFLSYFLIGTGGIWVAPSSLRPFPGFGIFTTRDIRNGESMLHSPDAVTIQYREGKRRINMPLRDARSRMWKTWSAVSVSSREKNEKRLLSFRQFEGCRSRSPCCPSLLFWLFSICSRLRVLILAFP